MSQTKAPLHELVPLHELLSKEESEKVLATYRVSRYQIPKIKAKDPALAGLGAKPGDIVKITRNDGSFHYRLVV
ncbi:MAG: DNA-directed RNA polymerase subunit H [Candidatus Micrarchaeota archaeon]|nr:DNA-directed RNA polymerase subunit H [Candidatus Micrarchaeota archaeon]